MARLMSVFTVAPKRKPREPSGPAGWMLPDGEKFD
jgi:hypothetical protein